VKYIMGAMREEDNVKKDLVSEIDNEAMRG
jgi:hypothetical protein